ncbi:MAG: hypothetical protein FWG30_10745 [Eubacteriaceae bacterium]|jgi:hypothetical protein|nr:hypothetical protein [Eubacteriaceae bacterium]
MTFGKREILSLENGFLYPTQFHMFFSDSDNLAEAVVNWIFTDTEQDSNMLFTNSTDTKVDSILSYKNSLIFIQLLSIDATDNYDNLVFANQEFIEGIVSYLESYRH